MTNDEIRRRAESAQSVLNNDIFKEVFDELKAEYISKWENSTDLDTKSREVYYNRVKAIQEVKREFIRLLNAAKFIDKG